MTIEKLDSGHRFINGLPRRSDPTPGLRPRGSQDPMHHIIDEINTGRSATRRILAADIVERGSS
jgi:hypothetical protein